MLPTARIARDALALVAAVGLALAMLPAAAGAKVKLAYPNFQSTEGLALNGSAVTAEQDGRWRLRLTDHEGQAGSAFTVQKLVSPRKPFKAYFRSVLHSGSLVPADGLTFTLHKAPASALGGAGNYLGYAGIPGKSIAIAHDLFDAQEQIEIHRVSLLRNGNVVKPLAYWDPFYRMDKLTLHTWVDYRAKKKTLRVYVDTRSKRPTRPVITHKINLARHFGRGKLRAGFTGATGMEWVTADVLAWRLSQR